MGNIFRKHNDLTYPHWLESLLFYISIAVTEHMTKAIYKKQVLNFGLQVLKG